MSDYYGYEFKYKNGRIGRSVPLEMDDIVKIESTCANRDNIFIYCTSCAVYMDFVEGKDQLLDGKWQCPKCRRRVRETTPYSQLERENAEGEFIFDDDYDENEVEDDFDRYLRCRGE